jgi:1-acyl-sn-glycerol-3-phosphate acyltransferase
MPRLWPPYDPDAFDQREPAFIERIVAIARRVHVPWHRGEVRGLERVPPGPALYVGNHNGGTWTPDTWIFAEAVHREHGLAGLPFGLGHDAVTARFPLNRITVPLGGVRATPANAERLLAAGHKVLVYPGGDLDAVRPFRHRHRIVFGGRRGYARIAIRAGVPIVPVVACGAHSTFVVIDDLRGLARLIHADRWARFKVWPLILCLPWGLAMGPAVVYFPYPSRITVEIGEPIAPAVTGPEAADDAAAVDALADRVESAMQATLDRLAAARRRPRASDR